MKTLNQHHKGHFHFYSQFLLVTRTQILRDMLWQHTPFGRGYSPTVLRGITLPGYNKTPHETTTVKLKAGYLKHSRLTAPCFK